jgi:putative component of membrane protein insertase Oxa1/YidC/SpoIIIJ protein YidD
MKIRTTAVAVVCLCITGLTAGEGEDSLVIAAAMLNTPGRAGGASALKSGRSGSPLGLARTIYSKFISSQDGNACCFSVSCSDYCVSAVRNNGVFKGALLTADRLTRCNGIQPDRYETDSLSGKNIDDVPGRIK